MTGKVWVSLMMKDSTLFKRLSADIVLNDKWNAIDASERHEKGEWLPAERFPKEIYGMFYDRKEKKLPGIFYGNGFWCVSAACAEVLLRFDLGKGGIYPVKLLQHDRVTPIEGEYFCLNFGAHKTAFLRELTTGGLYIPQHQGSVVWLSSPVDDFSIAVSENALEGPDLWMDPGLGKAIFFSDRLVGALKAANMSRRFRFRKCRIVEAEENQSGKSP